MEVMRFNHGNFVRILREVLIGYCCQISGPLSLKPLILVL